MKFGPDCARVRLTICPSSGQQRCQEISLRDGHDRYGHLLVPITAHVMAELLNGHKPDCDLTAFSPLRFG